VIVTLPEVTPVSQAAALQDDLRRAKHRALGLGAQQEHCRHRHHRPAATERIAHGLAQRTFVLPWLPLEPVGVAALGALVAPGA
jgi:arsenite/tail-anchored protein-transporting ATPase